jgi:hypothetical protein
METVGLTTLPAEILGTICTAAGHDAAVCLRATSRAMRNSVQDVSDALIRVVFPSSHQGALAAMTPPAREKERLLTLARVLGCEGTVTWGRACRLRRLAAAQPQNVKEPPVPT